MTYLKDLGSLGAIAAGLVKRFADQVPLNGILGLLDGQVFILTRPLFFSLLPHVDWQAGIPPL